MSVDSPVLTPLLPPSGSVADWLITTPGIFTGQWIVLEGVEAIAAKLQFNYGSGGVSVSVYVQSSLDLGSNSFDLARINFTTATRIAMFSIVRSNSAVLGPNDAGLESEGVVTTAFGDYFRLKIVVVGTYVDTDLSALVLPT